MMRVRSIHRMVLRLSPAIAACALVAGCASEAFDESTFFANPAKYDLYDCKQLAEVRKTKSARVDELGRLMAKAQTGTGGAVISEVAYRSDYVAAKADLKLADRIWEQNRCEGQILSTRQRLPASALPATASGGRVY